MDRLNESDTVRIVRIDGPVEAHTVSDDEVEAEDLAPWRVPVIGDVGTVLHLFAADGKGVGNPDNPGTRYIVQGVGSDGRTEWLAEFARGELELVKRPRS
jgi:hypothetical protein